MSLDKGDLGGVSDSDVELSTEPDDRSNEETSLDTPAAEIITRPQVSAIRPPREANEQRPVSSHTARYPPKPTAAQLQMRYDRRRFQLDKKLNRTAAARCIAEKRFDEMREDDFFHQMSSRAQPANSRVHVEKTAAVERQQAASMPNYWRTEYTDKPKSGKSARHSASREDVGSEKFQHSGKAALEIAESYLRGDLYRLLLQKDPSSGLDADDDTDCDVGHNRGEEHESNNKWPYVACGRTEGGVSVKTMPRRFENVPKDNVSSYENGWRSSKGGWVADFGPLHTHALSVSTAPKRAFHSNLPKQKKDTAQDEPNDVDYSVDEDVKESNGNLDGSTGDDVDDHRFLEEVKRVSFVDKEGVKAVASEQVYGGSMSLLQHIHNYEHHEESY